jgi:hypothetical protein
VSLRVMDEILAVAKRLLDSDPGRCEHCGGTEVHKVMTDGLGRPVGCNVGDLRAMAAAVIALNETGIAEVMAAGRERHRVVTYPRSGGAVSQMEAQRIEAGVHLPAQREDGIAPECQSDEAALREKVKELSHRLLLRAHEEPPSGWLQPGEEGYENTPEGASEARDAAIARAERAELEVLNAERRERAKIVAWLRSHLAASEPEWCADAIERGEHDL